VESSTIYARAATHTHIYILLLNSQLIIFEGKSSKSRDYEIPGSKVGKVFNAFGAISAIIVCNTSGLLLEIQVNITNDEVSPNIYKSLQYLSVHYAVNFAKASSQEHEESLVCTIYRGAYIILRCEHCRVLGLWVNGICIPS
jgi:hypothetical protein